MNNAHYIYRQLLKLTAIALCTVFASMGSAQTDSTSNEAITSLFNSFLDGKPADKSRALIEFTSSAVENKRLYLEGLLDGDLMAIKKTRQIVWVVAAGRDVEMFALADRSSLGKERKRKLQRLSINNKLRTEIKGLLASLELRNTNPDIRLAAAEALLGKPDAVPAETLDELLASETDTQVTHVLQTMRYLQQLSAGSIDERRAALEYLQDDLSPVVRQSIRTASSSDTDEELQALATSIVVSQQQQISIYKSLETLFFGLSLGSVLVLAAIGLAITFGVMGVINMAHGELIMLGAYTTWGVQQLLPDSLGLALILAIPAAFCVSGLVGIAIERGVIRFLYGRPLETLLATFGISLILQQAVRTFVSAQNVSVANPDFMSGVWQINAAFSVTYNRLFILLFCLIVFALLQQLLRRSRFGLEVRAVSQNRPMARSMGVKAARIDAATFGLGAGVAGVAGVALSQITNVGPNLGQSYIVDSFMVVVFGGVGNLWGTLISGMTLGVINKVLEPWAGAVLAKILVLVFLILFIQKRPRGLFAQRGRAVEAGS